MRLGQLARKLEVKPADIVKFLADEKKTEINAHPNSKIDDDLIPIVTARFGNDNEEEKEQNTTAKPEQITKEETEAVAEKIEEVDEPSENDEIIDSKSIQVPVDLDNVEHIETIKPEKLSGPKIIDKIELPPPPPPEMIEVDGVMMEKAEYKKKKAEEQKRKREARKKSIESGYAKRNLKVEKQPENDTVILSEKEKKKIDRELERKRKKQEEIIARKRREHYLKQQEELKKKAIKKKKNKSKNIDERFVEEETIDNSTTAPIPEEPKLSLLARIWKWFNT